MKSSEASSSIFGWSRTASVRRRSHLEFLPAALEIVETPASPGGRAVALTICLFFVLALGWSILGRIDIVAVAQGKIVPTGRTKTVQPLESGIVTSILVRDGDHVKSGQVVMELDSTIARAERDRLVHDLAFAQLDIARLSALRAAIDQNVAVDTAFAPPSGTKPADLARTRAAMLQQFSAQDAKIAGIRQQMEQKAGEGDEVAATIDKLESTLPFLSEQASIRRKAAAIEFGNKIADLDAQLKLTDQSKELVVQHHRSTEIASALKGLERQLAQAQAEYATKILEDLTGAEQKLAQVSEDLRKAEQKLEQQVLRAPVAGTVQQLAVHSVGGVVTPAQQLLMIVPSDSRLEIEATIANRDVGFVRPDQDAEIKIDTFNFTRYGLLHGHVVDVSHDAVVREKPVDRANPAKSQAALGDTSEPQGQEYVYVARVALDQTQLDVDGRLVDLGPGMATTVEIKTGSRRIIEYLMSPVLRYRQESLRER